MKSFLKKVLPVMAVFAVLASILNFSSYNPYNELATFVPASAGAAELDLTLPVLGAITLPNLDVPNLNTTAIAFTSCDISASANSVTTGDSVTISWETSGFANVTVNGVAMPNLNGSQTFSNILTTTTYTLVATTADGSSNCTAVVTVGCVPPVVPAPTCTLTPASATVTSGQSVDLTWTTTNAASASLSPFGAVGLNGTRNTGPITNNQNYTLTVVGNNGQTITCASAVTVKPVTQIPSCPISPKAGRIISDFGGKKLLSNSTLAESQTNLFSANVPAGTYDITLVAWDGYAGRELASQAFETYKVNMYANITLVGTTNATTDLADNVVEAIRVDKVNSRYVLPTAISAVQAKHAAYPNNTSANSLYPICIAFDPVVEETTPTCDAFTASPTTIVRGNSSNLNWATTNATAVTINNGVGVVPVDGTFAVSPIATTEYTLTATDANNKQAICKVTVNVETPNNPLPTCDAFTASPASLPAGGGSVNLTWATTNATGVSIAPTIGAVAVDGSTTTSITTSTNFVLTATNGNGQSQCTVNVPVASTPTPISCAANVNLSASPTSITRGNSSTLTWSTTGITSLSFNNGVTATGLSGSTTVTPNDSTTYTMTATDGKTTINCPVTVSVSTGGGGGGSSSPRCELEVSDNTIESGDRVTLTWDTSRATTVILEDKTAKNTLVTTDGLSSSAKERLYDGDIKVSPKKDTTYTLTAKRGSKTRTCTVKVDVKDDVVVKTVRDQQPLVSGISLTEVPYTGFEAGPILTLLFYTLLLAWALYMAYLLVIRRDVLGGLKLALAKSETHRFVPEQVRPDVFVASVQAPSQVAVVPANLPVANSAVVGYAAAVANEVADTTDEEVAKIENHAHSKRVLLSSDAIRHFIGTTNSATERTVALDQVIDAAKAQFPAEDGWIVVNEKRMADLCLVCAANAPQSSAAPYVPAVIPEGSGSLAEAIVTGNVVAAYELIGHRPMFALADAAADLDAVYRIRRGEEATASELLMKETANLSNETVLAMIQALTGALDGTYTNEEAAVKMAIMKAIKAAA